MSRIPDVSDYTNLADLDAAWDRYDADREAEHAEFKREIGYEEPGKVRDFFHFLPLYLAAALGALIGGTFVVCFAIGLWMSGGEGRFLLLFLIAVFGLHFYKLSRPS